MTARRSSSRHYCTVCRSWYRTWALHASSKTHMGNLRKRATPSSSRKGIRGGFAKPAKARGRQQGDDMVDVEQHKRNPPTPPWPAWLTERLVRVRRHFRRPPYVATGTYRPSPGKRSSSFARQAAAIARARGWR